MKGANWPKFDSRDEQLLLEAFRSGCWWRGAYDSPEGEATGGEGFVQRFEKEVGRMHDASHCIAVSSGTMALDIAVRSLNLQPYDEVITTPYTYSATATSILQSGAVPVFADIDANTWNLDPEAVRRACTERTKAIIIVHFGGYPCDMDKYIQIARERNIVLIEDTAHAFGAQWKGRPIGSIGDIGCFSFQASKNVTTGEGGAITTNNDEMASILYSLHMAGRREGGQWYEHDRLGWNGRMTEFQGAIGLAQIEKFPMLHQQRQENASYMVRALSELAGITVQPVESEHIKHGLHLICFRYEKEHWGNLTPKRLYMAFRAAGVPVIRGYEKPLYHNEVLKNPPAFVSRTEEQMKDWPSLCPNAENLSETTFWLHHSLLLKDRNEIDNMIQSIIDVQAKYKNRM
jgi:dTDP-4-amino-4,6-dideoxygalactose transaminase